MFLILLQFRFASTRDRLLMLIGTLAACAHGASMPVMVIVFGDMSDAFIYDEMWRNIAEIMAANITAMCPILMKNCTTPPPCTLKCDWCVNITSDYIAENPSNVTYVIILSWLSYWYVVCNLTSDESSLLQRLLVYTRFEKWQPT